MELFLPFQRVLSARKPVYLETSSVEKTLVSIRGNFQQESLFLEFSFASVPSFFFFYLYLGLVIVVYLCLVLVLLTNI